MEFGQCQISVDLFLGNENEYRARHISCQTEIYREPSVGQARAFTILRKMRLGYRSAFICVPARFEIIWTQELADAETAKRADHEPVSGNRCKAADSISVGPGVKEIESLKTKETTGKLVTVEEVNTDQVVERDGGPSRQLDENQLQLWMCSWIEMPQQLLQSKEQKHN